MERIDFNRVRIDILDDKPNKVWIYMLDESNEPVEGGEFDLHEFMDAVLRFYNGRY